MRCRKCLAGEPHSFKHNLGGYNYHGCRCKTCCKHQSERNSKRYPRPEPTYTEPRPGVKCLRCRLGEVHEIKHGHIGYNYHGCRCSTCRAGERARKWNLSEGTKERMRARAREYSREYRQRHYGKVVQKHRDYVEANRESIRASNRAKYRENPQHYREKNRAYREQNRERWTEIYGLRDYNRRPKTSEERERDRLRRNAKNDRTRSAASRAGGRWTPAEDAIVMRPDVTITEMCFMLGRSISAVACRQVRLRKRLGCNA